MRDALAGIAGNSLNLCLSLSQLAHLRPLSYLATSVLHLCHDVSQDYSSMTTWLCCSTDDTLYATIMRENATGPPEGSLGLALN